VVKKLASLKSLYGTATGEDLLLAVSETMKELDLPCTKLTEVTTDRAPSMTRNKTGMISIIRRKMHKKNHEFYMELRCIIHLRSLCWTTLISLNKLWCRLWTSIDLTDLIIASVFFFLLVTSAQDVDILYDKEVRQLSRGAVLKRFLALRLKTETFVNNKGKVVVQLIKEMW